MLLLLYGEGAGVGEELLLLLHLLLLLRGHEVRITASFCSRRQRRLLLLLLLFGRRESLLGLAVVGRSGRTFKDCFCISNPIPNW